MIMVVYDLSEQSAIISIAEAILNMLTRERQHASIGVLERDFFFIHFNNK